MKYASQTATEKRDYQWNADSEEFRAVAEEEWSRWHDEYADSLWFGVISRHQKLLFLAGKIPTGRYDYAHRRISSFIVLQPENEQEKSQIINLTANLLLGKNEQPFYSWADGMAMAQENQTAIPGWFLTETIPQEGDISIGRKEYPLNEDSIDDRQQISKSLRNLVDSRQDFVVAVINHSASSFYKKVCNDLSQDARIAVFSKSTITKKKFPEPETHESLIQKGINIVKKHMPKAVLIVLLLGMFFSFNGKVKKLNSQIQDLQTQTKEIETLNTALTGLAEKYTSLESKYVSEIYKLNRGQTELFNASSQIPSLQAQVAKIEDLKTDQIKLSRDVVAQSQALKTASDQFVELVEKVNNIQNTLSMLPNASPPAEQTPRNNQSSGTEINN